MSEIRANTVSNAAGTGPVTLTGQYAAKAWVNFNGTGTVAIRESGNVSSITDNGTGDYDVNFSNALADVNYASNVSAGRGGASSGNTASSQIDTTSYATSLIGVFITKGDNNLVDCSTVNVSVFR